jgi:ribose transport system substrate-binding protein
MTSRSVTKALALALSAGVLVAACSGGAATPAPATPAPATPAPATEAPATEAPAATEAPVVTEAPMGFACAAPADFAPVWYASAPHPYFDTVKPGVEAAGAEFGFSPVLQVGPDWNQDSQNQGMQALFAKGSRYFTVYPSDANGANALYEELTAEGATVVNFGGSTAEPTPAKLVFATDVKAAASQAAEALISTMGGKGNIINVLEVLEDPNTVLRKEGIEEVVAKYPDVKIIQEISGMKSAEEAVQKVTDAIAANSSTVDGIIATGFTPSVAIAQVLADYKAQGGDRTIHAVGIDTDPIVIKAIEDGVMDGTISQNPFGHGYLSTLALMCMADGWAPKEGVYRVDTGTAFVTKDNLTTYADDIAKVTEQIKATLTTDVLTK